MRLSPPASSSDLELARNIARRLSRLATPGEIDEAPLPPYAPFPGARPAAPPAEAPRLDLRPAPAPALNPETVRRARGRVPDPHPPAAPKPVPPPRPAPPPPPPADEDVGVLPDEEPAPPPAPPPPPPRPAPPAPKAAPARPAPPPPPPPPPPATEPEESEIAVETESEAASEAEVSPDMEVDFEAAARAAAEAVAEVEPEEAAAPSWADILKDCLYLARASAALLIDGQGQVLASSGDWPPPGPEAIGAKLVPAMDKALRTAPNRSVSVPLGALHLTAWRVEVAESMVTVGFVAEAALKGEVRPAIDAEVKRGTPA